MNEFRSNLVNSSLIVNSNDAVTLRSRLDASGTQIRQSLFGIEPAMAIFDFLNNKAPDFDEISYTDTFRAPKKNFKIRLENR